MNSLLSVLKKKKDFYLLYCGCRLSWRVAGASFLLSGITVLCFATVICPEVSTSGVLSPSGSSVASLSASSVGSLQATLEQVMLILEEKRKREGRPENIKVGERREGGNEDIHDLRTLPP